MTGRTIVPFQKPPIKRGGLHLTLKNICTKNIDDGALKNISFDVHKGEVVGIAGVEGNGQSTLVDCLLGLTDYDGQIEFEGKPYSKNTQTIREKLNIGYVAEDRHSQSLWLDGSIEDNCAIGFSNKLSKGGWLRRSRVRKHSADCLKDFDVRYDHMGQKIHDLSGGNQQKVIIARELQGRMPSFMLTCHPTRGVDVGAIEFIHKRLVQYQESGGSMVLISSEIEELFSLSDRVLVFFKGQIVLELKRDEFDLKKVGQAMLGGLNA
jgi:simple sugar transport system ATP-binding protein